MVMEMQRFPLSSGEMDLESVVALSALAICLWRLCCDFDLGPFTKVACFDLAKVVEGGTTAWYGRALPVPVVAKPFDSWLRGPFDLGI
jgi:hypothetical protein